MATIAGTGARQPAGNGERWGATDSWNFTSFVLGMLLEAYIFGMASIATGWVTMPTALRSLLLSWAPLWLIIGIAVAGPLSDRVGRKTTFYLTMGLYGVGAVGLTFSGTYWLILVFLAIMLFAAGGEMNTIMTASHEVMPHRHRSKTMMLEINGINLGGLILAAVSLASAEQGHFFQRGMIAATFLIVLLVLFFARTKTPESIRWLQARGQDARARTEIERYFGAEQWAAREAAAQAATRRSDAGTERRRAPISLRLFATTATAFAGTAGFGLMTYVLGPEHFPTLTATILLVATLTGFVSGFFGFWADRLSRKQLLLAGYAGSLLLTLVILITKSTWASSLGFFWLLLVVLNVFVNIAYLTEDTLKGEVWPTRRRGTYTAVVRFVSIGLYIATIYITQSFNASGLILFSMLVWAIGLAGAVAWYFGGVETGRGVSLDVASGQ
ncbi:MAG TPA: MFS transporter [Verrucomicrobiae bacterium]|nr:MFS transporter [Verrucomicrobiae bacterium]